MTKDQDPTLNDVIAITETAFGKLETQIGDSFVRVEERILKVEDNLSSDIELRIGESEARLLAAIQGSEERLAARLTSREQEIDILQSSMKEIDSRLTLLEHKLRH